MKVQSARIAGMLITAMVLTNCLGTFGEAATITEQRAIEIADSEVKRLGKDLSKLERDVDKTWERYLKRNPQLLKNYPDAATKLKGRSYRSITYGPTDPLVRGGGYTMFVDKETGEILTIIRYE